MLAVFEILVEILVPGIVLGGLAGFLVLRSLQQSVGPEHSTKSRSSGVLSQFLTNASEAFEKPSTGGSMHLPNVHVGAHLLRVRKTETGSYLIMRRHGEFPVAHLELETEDAAVEMFEVLHRHMVEEELTGAPQRVIRRGERELLLKYNAGPRRFSLHRNDSVLKVTDMLGKRLCGAAIVANEEHGQELFELLITHYERGAGDPSGTFDLLTPRPHLTV